MKTFKGKISLTRKAFEENKKILGIRVELTGRKGGKVFTEVNAAPLYDLNGDLFRTPDSSLFRSQLLNKSVYKIFLQP